MTRPVFGAVLPCPHCGGSGIVARNGRPAGQELVDALRAAGMHPRDVPGDELYHVAITRPAGLFGPPIVENERVLRRCRTCAGEGTLERRAGRKADAEVR